MGDHLLTLAESLLLSGAPVRKRSMLARMAGRVGEEQRDRRLSPWLAACGLRECVAELGGGAGRGSGCGIGGGTLARWES